jgi:plastocyanin
MEAHPVKIENIDFHPAAIRIRRGEVVKWRFLDKNTPHNVTSRGRLRFRSSRTREDGTHSVRFRRAGTYRYVCTIHFNMKGRVVVR